MMKKFFLFDKKSVQLVNGFDSFKYGKHIF